MIDQIMYLTYKQGRNQGAQRAPCDSSALLGAFLCTSCTECTVISGALNLNSFDFSASVRLWLCTPWDFVLATGLGIEDIWQFAPE